MANEEVVLDQPGAQAEEPVVDNSSVPQDSSGTETEQLDTTTEGSPEGVEQAEEPYQLPDVQEKVFPFEEIAKFGKSRYGYSEQEIKADPRLQRALHDKLNSDILIAEQKAMQEQQAEVAEEIPEPTVEAPQQFDPTAWDKQANEYIQQNTDPVRAAAFVDGLIGSLSKAASPGATAQDKVQAAISLRTMLIDALRTDLPTFLQTAAGGGKSLVDQILSKHEEKFNSQYEGFNDFWNSTAKERAWDQIKSSDPEYADLPKLGTPEWDAALEKAAEMVPGFENFQYRDPKTKQFVSEHRNFVEKSKILARVLKGKSVEPPIVKQAFASGQKAAVQQQKKAVLAKTFGAGQSTGKTGGTKDQLMEAIERENATKSFPKV